MKWNVASISYLYASSLSLAGIAFMHVQATDADDPASENADLRYTILDSDQNLFHIEPRSGAVSLTEEGKA